jgi:hypothetical protein
MPKSIYSEPMPSPNGTNYERLYIVRKPFAEAMALDAAMPKYGSGDNGDPDDIDINETDNVQRFTLAGAAHGPLDGDPNSWDPRR